MREAPICSLVCEWCGPLWGCQPTTLHGLYQHWAPQRPG